jgi:telomerase reverse transcriptase
MGKKRKRPVKEPVKDDPICRAKSSPQQPAGNTARSLSTNRNQAADAGKICHPVISLYYRHVVTLRQYILQRIPRSSRARRRRIAAVGGHSAARDGLAAVPKNEKDLADLLDTTLVGILKELPPTRSEERRRDFIAFTQAQQTTQTGTDSGPVSPQSEVK